MIFQFLSWSPRARTPEKQALLRVPEAARKVSLYADLLSTCFVPWSFSLCIPFSLDL